MESNQSDFERALSVVEADTGLFLLEEMARHNTYRLNIATLVLPVILDAIFQDSDNLEKALEFVEKTVENCFNC